MLFVISSSLGLLLSACSPPPQAVSPAQPPETIIANPLLRLITEWDEYTGRFQPVEEVEIRARVSGYLQKVRFNDGQKVKAGDVLFVIDQRSFKIAKDRATAQYELALKERKRAEKLHKTRAISQEDLDRRVQEYLVAKSVLDQAKLDIEFTEVKSPIDGRVSRDLVNEGNLITGGSVSATLLTTVVSIDPIHFYFDAGERELLKYIRLNQSGQREGSRTAKNPAYVKLRDQEEYSYLGHMDFVDNRVDNSTGTIQGRVIFDNEDEIIQPGMFGRARLIGRKGFEALLVPDNIIATDQSRKFVYVVNQENIIEMRVITPGRLHSRDLRVVESGLTINDQVVIKGIQRVRAGMQVTPITEVIFDNQDLEDMSGNKSLGDSINLKNNKNIDNEKKEDVPIEKSWKNEEGEKRKVGKVS